MKLSKENILKAINSLRNQKVYEDNYVLWFNPYEWILSKRYRGVGRPKESDYDYIENKELMNFLKTRPKKKKGVNKAQ